MGRNSKIVVAAILALAIVGCSSDGEQQSSNPTLTNTPTTIKKGATVPFNNPVVPAKKALFVTSSRTSSLIQPTNATERAAIVSKGRADPFAPLPAIEVLNTTLKERTAPVSSGAGSVTVTGVNPLAQMLAQYRSRMATAKGVRETKKSLAIATTTKTNKPATRPIPVQKKPYAIKNLTQPVLPKVLPQVIPNQTLASVLPPPPQPELAKAVLVTGVVLVGQEPQAIIKVPNEPTSRYVQAGQRLASGLLIKRIEMNEGSEPTVILEQYGIEVAKMVGEAPSNSKPSSASPGAT